MTATINAFLSKYGELSADMLHTATPEELARNLVVSPHDYTAGSTAGDYILVGKAEVSITLFPRAEVVSGQVAALRKQIDDERRDSGLRLLRLERQINNLLCIENAASEVAA